MALTVLNNISSLTAENALSNTQMNLQKTLTQLSTGLKINSGSDDAAGLSIASGLNANIAALTQSQQNASNGVGLLQTADGALSQVTTLLNRAVTLATEGATSGITTTQATALNTEFVSIKAEIDQIGQATNFNGSNVFTASAPPTFTSTQGSVAVPLTMSAALTTSSLLTAGSVTTVTGTAAFSYTAKAGDTVASLITAINGQTGTGAGTAASIVNGKLSIDSTAHLITAVTSNDAQLGTGFSGGAGAAEVSGNNVAGPVLTAGSITTIQDSGTGGTFSFTAKAGESLTDLNNAIKDAVTSGTLSAGDTATIDGSGQMQITSNNANVSLKVASTDAALGVMTANTPAYVTTSATPITNTTTVASGAVVTVNYANSSVNPAETFTAGSGATVAGLVAAINSGTTASGWTVAGTYNAKTTAQINGSGQLEVDDNQGDISSVVTSGTASNLGTLSAINGSNNTSTVYLGDGTTTGALNTQITTTINALSSLALGLGSDTLLSSASATTALADVTNAINSVSAQRGVIGASVNRLNAASSNMSSQVNNLQSAANSIQNADIGKTVAAMTQYNILQSTGMAALQQSNQAQQAVLKLVQ